MHQGVVPVSGHRLDHLVPPPGQLRQVFSRQTGFDLDARPWQSMRVAETASVADMPKSTILMITWSMALVIFAPPGAPIMIFEPRPSSRTVGAMPLTRAFPGAMEFARPGTGLKQFMALLY